MPAEQAVHLYSNGFCCARDSKNRALVWVKLIVPLFNEE